MDHDLSRRGFLSGTTTALVATGAATAGRTSANETIRLGLIGCGGIMNAHSRNLGHFGSSTHVSWLCDVDPRQMDRIAANVDGYQKTAPRRTSRFEDVLADRSVDAVIIGTPHHWHARIALLALAAGKDTYIEKPMSHVFNEGRAIIEAARKYKRVVQHGSQMRSSPVTAAAGKLLAEGLLGEIRITKAWNVQRRGTRKIVPNTKPPAGVDYDRWLGPAPVKGFNVNRFHSNWRVYRDYGNGDIGDDGIHDIDMARWGLGVTTQPVRVTAHGSHTFYSGKNRGDREFPDNMMVNYEYADGRVLIYEDRLFTAYGMHGFDSGNAFYGTEGYMIFSRRGAFRTYLGPKSKPGPTEPKQSRTNRGYAPHLAEFLDAIGTRNFDTRANADIAHLSCSLVHLGEVAFRTQGRLDFDPKTETFVDSPQANAMLTKAYRKGYELPRV
ncbi:MAG: Gfo/Idh/MocA family oxidoreductase [Planctomycetaceae bacterium]